MPELRRRWIHAVPAHRRVTWPLLLGRGSLPSRARAAQTWSRCAAERCWAAHAAPASLQLGRAATEHPAARFRTAPRRCAPAPRPSWLQSLLPPLCPPAHRPRFCPPRAALPPFCASATRCDGSASPQAVTEAVRRGRYRGRILHPSVGRRHSEGSAVLKHWPVQGTRRPQGCFEARYSAEAWFSLHSILFYSLHCSGRVGLPLPFPSRVSRRYTTPRAGAAGTSRGQRRNPSSRAWRWVGACRRRLLLRDQLQSPRDTTRTPTHLSPPRLTRRCRAWAGSRDPRGVPGPTARCGAERTVFPGCLEWARVNLLWFFLLLLLVFLSSSHFS